MVSVFDRKDEPLTELEKHAKDMAKRKMLGNLKFIGKYVVAVVCPALQEGKDIIIICYYDCADMVPTPLKS